MATNFSANQYDDAFRPRRIRNWETPKRFQEMPRTSNGSTKITAIDNGHLLPEYRRSKSDPWGSFVGTWDLPKRLPGNNIDVPTARSVEASEKLRRDFERSKTRFSGTRWGTYNNTFYKEGTQTYAAPVRGRSKQGAPFTSTFDDTSASLLLPRKLSPIERNGNGAKHGDRADGMLSDGDAGFEQSYRLDDNRIPLPQLNRPVFADGDENVRYTIAAM